MMVYLPRCVQSNIYHFNTSDQRKQPVYILHITLWSGIYHDISLTTGIYHNISLTTDLWFGVAMVTFKD